MADVISDYQRWKEQGESLRSQARQAMEARFRDLLMEAAAIAEEYRADFGAPLKPPSSVTAFRYKTSGKPKAKKPAKPAGPAKAAEPARSAPPGNGAPADPKVAKLRKQLDGAKKKLADAKSAGTPTRALEDRVYEIEDALRLANETA
jgi:hypothetical protein